MEQMLNQDLHKLQAQALKLEQEVRDCIAAEQLMNFEAGQVLIRWLTARINLSTQKITGAGYKQDHTGYLEELAKLEENRFILRKIQASSSEEVKDKLNSKLNELQDTIKDGQ